jgi:hypothetical protein
MLYRLSSKGRTSDALRCRRDYHKREKNVKKIILDLFADLAVFESGTSEVNYFEIHKCIKTTSNRIYYQKVQDHSLPISDPA